MGYKVSLASSSSLNVKLGTASSLKVQQGGGGTGAVAQNLSELNDVDQQGIGNRFVLVYDAVTSAFKFVNPDEVVTAAATDGLSTETIEELDTALDDKINLDAGDF